MTKLPTEPESRFLGHAQGIFISTAKKFVHYAKWLYLCLVKKSISIILLGIYMLSTAPFNEVVKVHVLVEHYFEHKALDSSLTLSEFFDIHYGEDVQKDADYERDMQLPFKTIGAESGAFALFHPSLPILKAFESPQTIFAQTPLDYSFTYSSHLLSSIWQPPRA